MQSHRFPAGLLELDGEGDMVSNAVVVEEEEPENSKSAELLLEYKLLVFLLGV